MLITKHRQLFICCFDCVSRLPLKCHFNFAYLHHNKSKIINLINRRTSPNSMDFGAVKRQLKFVDKRSRRSLFLTAKCDNHCYCGQSLEILRHLKSRKVRKEYFRILPKLIKPRRIFANLYFNLPGFL